VHDDDDGVHDDDDGVHDDDGRVADHRPSIQVGFSRYRMKH
jgi:hypothetical protein